MKNILVIDDDIHIGNVLEETLTKEGYGVYRAYSGTEALFVLSQSKPDLVLLDLMLPGLNGEEVLPQIKGIPVIVLSAKADVDDKVDVLLGGAADYVTKPFNTRYAHCNHKFQRDKADEDRVCYFKDAFAKPDAGHHKVTAVGPDKWGYARLHREFSENAHKQFAKKTS